VNRIGANRDSAAPLSCGRAAASAVCTLSARVPARLVLAWRGTGWPERVGALGEPLVPGCGAPGRCAGAWPACLRGRSARL